MKCGERRPVPERDRGDRAENDWRSARERLAQDIVTRGYDAEAGTFVGEYGGADVDARSPNGNTPLMLAASRSRLEVVELLLEYGADIDARNERRSTSLILAVEGRSPEVVSALLEGGATTRYRNRDGESAHAIAQRTAQTEILEVFDTQSEGGGILSLF